MTCDKDAIFTEIFIQTLNPELGRYVARAKVKTLQDAFKLVRTYDGSELLPGNKLNQSDTAQLQYVSSKKVGTQKDNICFNCNKKGHVFNRKHKKHVIKLIIFN